MMIIIIIIIVQSFQRAVFYSYRFKMNCESSDAILQTYVSPANAASDGGTDEVSEEEEHDVIGSETEFPADESDLYNYKSAMYDENGDLIAGIDGIVEIKKEEFDKNDMLEELEEDEMPAKTKKESTKEKSRSAKKIKTREQPVSSDNGTTLHICEICANTYKYRHALEVHMRRHRGEKNFSCEYCERSFVIRFELKRHMR